MVQETEKGAYIRVTALGRLSGGWEEQSHVP